MNSSDQHKVIMTLSISRLSSALVLCHNKRNIMHLLFKTWKIFSRIKVEEELFIPLQSKDSISKGLFLDNVNLIRKLVGECKRKWRIPKIHSIKISILILVMGKIKIQKAELLVTRMGVKTVMFRWFLVLIWMISQSLTRCPSWPWVKAIFGPSLVKNQISHILEPEEDLRIQRWRRR